MNTREKFILCLISIELLFKSAVATAKCPSMLTNGIFDESPSRAMPLPFNLDPSFLTNCCHCVNGVVKTNKTENNYEFEHQNDLSSATSPSSLSSSDTTHAASSSSPATTSGIGFELNPILSRAKRYIAFPEGSSFSVAVCATVGIIGNPRFNYMSFGLNWGVAYDLPNETWVLNHLNGFAKHPVPAAVLRRRTRRQLYKEIERAVENMGYNGRECVLRALCESRQYFQVTKMGMIGEMLRVIFSLPKQRIFTRELRENSDIEKYDRAYRKARSVDCSEQYVCSFSLLELALGKYSEPPVGYYKFH